MTGQTIVHYNILEKLGDGGMGEVYKARDLKLDRFVALKFLTRVGPLTSSHRERFRQEAKSLAALNHPNIVTIFDIDEADGIPFLVLEWIAGRDLGHSSLQRPIDVTVFREIALPIAEALAAAHKAGIVHRDIKPQNVLISDEGRVKLVDFGLAKLTDRGHDLTAMHTLVGTAAYMSPEQTMGAETGPASDIFSFGVLAYELLTGQRPFDGAHIPALVYAIANVDHLPLRERRSDLPDEVCRIIERCLAKDPAERWQNGKELAEQLTRLGDVSGSKLELMPQPRGDRGAKSQEQEIRFCTTVDGVRIAYSVIGTGQPIVRVLGWFTHLEMEWSWADLRLFWESLAGEHTVVRYDGRGMGLSDRFAGEFTEETRLLDLDAVLEAVGVTPVALFGISEGGWTAARYANEHPRRVSHLILYGSYARGARARPGYDMEEDHALRTLMRKGWGRESPEFRQIFTTQFFPGGANPELIAHFNELQRQSADGETAARYTESCHRRGDGSGFFAQVKTPTLVVHCRDDRVVGFEEGRHLATIIPGAKFLPLPSGTHYFPTNQTVTKPLVEAIERFVAGRAHSDQR